MPQKSKDRDYIYEKAPVVEVIAEVLWELKPILGAGLAYDPFFDVFAEEFFKQIQKSGYKHDQMIVPPDVPREILAHKPILRIREEKDKWPLYQVGPGIFTANVTPPYKGWEDFSPVAKKGLDVLFKSYPDADKYLKPKTVRLVYINAFGEDNGYKNQRQFLDEGLNFSLKLPEEILNNHVQDEDVNSIAEFNFKLKELENSHVSLKIGSGLHNGKEAMIVENRISRKFDDNLRFSKDQIIQWFNDARCVNHDIFEQYITDETKKTFGKKSKKGKK